MWASPGPAGACRWLVMGLTGSSRVLHGTVTRTPECPITDLALDQSRGDADSTRIGTASGASSQIPVTCGGVHDRAIRTGRLAANFGRTGRRDRTAPGGRSRAYHDRATGSARRRTVPPRPHHEIGSGCRRGGWFMRPLVPYLVLWAHLVGDFVVQTDRQATNKEHCWRAMAGHLLGYHVPLTAVAIYGWGLTLPAAALVAVSVLSHAVIDRRWPVVWLMRATGSAGFAEEPIGRLAVDQVCHLTCLLGGMLLASALA
jgi:Protein of unknown function (DUF3307)